ncbi:MAG: hypothetical protein J7J70_11060, partial [Deltaproteobacteria bacterium]|nr:hypothetical protein [Candidatus Tharpellaceae bacterium]
MPKLALRHQATSNVPIFGCPCTPMVYLFFDIQHRPIKLKIFLFEGELRLIISGFQLIINYLL